jgi:hypothetical protein
LGDKVQQVLKEFSGLSEVPQHGGFVDDEDLECAFIGPPNARKTTGGITNCEVEQSVKGVGPAFHLTLKHLGRSARRSSQNRAHLDVAQRMSQGSHQRGFASPGVALENKESLFRGL